MPAKKKVAKKIARQPKVEPWRAELARIVRFLNKNEVQSEKLWWVLTALRGPDTNDPAEEVKSATTAVIRNTVGLTPLRNGYCNKPDESEFIERRKKLRASDYTSYDHFYYHVKNAFQTLGLKWDEVN